MIKDNGNTMDQLGFCSICATLHISSEGFVGQRKCRDCGEQAVYSVQEYQDTMNDYHQVVADYNTLLNSVEYSYDD